MDNNSKIEFHETTTPGDNESGEAVDMFLLCAERLMEELDLEVDMDEPESPDTISYAVPKEIKTQLGSIIMVLDFVYDLAGKTFDAEAHDDDPFMDGEKMKAMIMGLPEQELSVMVRGLMDPVLRGFAMDALAEKARRASETWQKRMHRKATAKFRTREKWKQ